METVTGLDYRALVEARGTLLAEAERRYGTTPGEDPHRALRDGIIYQACKVADDAVFMALNALGSYGGDAEALRVVHMRGWEEPS